MCLVEDRRPAETNGKAESKPAAAAEITPPSEPPAPKRNGRANGKNGNGNGNGNAAKPPKPQEDEDVSNL